MANIESNRSPSPLTSRNFRNSETNSNTRRSFNGNPFSRPNSLTSPKNLNAPTPANTPATTDHPKRNMLVRKSVGNSTSSMFQDGKENQKDALKSPAKGGSKNFMSPTISAASKFNPSPRKKILGEKNDVTRPWVQFYGKDSDLKSEPTSFNQTLESSTVVEQQKEVVIETSSVVNEVTLKSTNDEKEPLSDIVTEDCESDFVKNRPFCCSPITSPIIAPVDADPFVPPYDPKKNFLSPRPQFLRYKPNPRIESLLTKDEYGEDDDRFRLEDSFNLSENSVSSDTELEGEEEQEKDEKEAELSDSVNGSSGILSDIVSVEKQTEEKVEKVSRSRLFTRSKTVSFLFVMFLVACFSLSFTDSPPMDLPIYKEVGFSEIYHESLKMAAFAKDSFDDLIQNVKQWSSNLLSYLSDQKSHFFPTHKDTLSIKFFNITPTSSINEEIVFNRHIGMDIIQEFHESNEELEVVKEESFKEMEVDDDFDLDEDESGSEDSNETEDGSSVAADSIVPGTKLNMEDGLLSKSTSESSLAADSCVPETKMNLEDKSEVEVIGEIKTSEVATDASELETLTYLLTESVNTTILVALSTAIMAISAVYYMIKIKPAANDDDNMCEESCSSETSIKKGYMKKSSNKNNNKRESMASSSSDFSMGSPSYGSFTTFERIPIKGDEVMLTPIRRSSRLLKNHAISS
ncbi:uncharacterized protein [Rutidosis leptorrhynchoides]|uniref:uncharacterized protein n=1 Tax=Rutidosis leptorrhynchoides TaxID=125765 RepID=UPI003A98F342